MSKEQRAIQNISDLPQKRIKIETPELFSLDFIYENDLETLEEGVRRVEKVSSACWYLQAAAVFRIFNDLLFAQSGLDKRRYVSQSEKRLGMDRRRVSDHYNAGSFLVKYQAKLAEVGWKPEGQQRKIAYAPRALRRHKDVDKVIKHLMHDSKEQFETFTLGPQTNTEDDVTPRDDIQIKNYSIYVGNIEAIAVNKNLDDEDRALFWSIVKQVAKALQEGYYPEILACYDSSEARIMQNALKRERQKK